ncbi:MAG: hypothetical protein ACXVDJ_08140 [Tumebacillaceae bacterium]
MADEQMNNESFEQEENRIGRQHYPEAMLDMGMPQEMSTYPERVGENNTSPFVEITEPFQPGEGLNEITRAEDLAKDL